MDELALFGGPKTINEAFLPYNSIGPEERDAAIRVIESGVLSRFIGAWHPDFYGGPAVQQFERDLESYFGVRHAVTLNSWTSGLIAAVGAVGIEPGDEVIVPTWTMSATATAVLHWNGIPVFCDINPDTYNICPESIERNITEHTRAIISVDIFGQSADMDEIMSLADRYKLMVISDSAQSPGALYKGKYAGTLAHVGGFSLNYHKHIHCGEGGVLVTDDDRIAQRARLIRNHAESVVGDMGLEDITNMIGHNFRLGEIEAAIGSQQLRKLDSLVASRQSLAERLLLGLGDLEGLKLPIVPKNQTHVYYVFPMQVDSAFAGASRDGIWSALKAEGVPVTNKYQAIHLLPIYQRRIAYGASGFPWTNSICKRSVSYHAGSCPVAEKLNRESYLGIPLCAYQYSRVDIDAIITAFKKVWRNRDLLAEVR